MNKKGAKKFDELLRAILCLKGQNEARRFFRDLLTEPEINEFSRRWQAARMLDGGIPYSQIEAATGLSSTTVARVSRWLKDGMGGYKLVLGRLGLSGSHHRSHSPAGKGFR